MYTHTTYTKCHMQHAHTCAHTHTHTHTQYVPPNTAKALSSINISTYTYCIHYVHCTPRTHMYNTAKALSIINTYIYIYMHIAYTTYTAHRAHTCIHTMSHAHCQSSSGYKKIVYTHHIHYTPHAPHTHMYTHHVPAKTAKALSDVKRYAYKHHLHYTPYATRTHICIHNRLPTLLKLLQA